MGNLEKKLGEEKISYMRKLEEAYSNYIVAQKKYAKRSDDMGLKKEAQDAYVALENLCGEIQIKYGSSRKE